MAASIVGIASRNENSAAALRDMPRNNPPIIVAPDRDVPGTSRSGATIIGGLFLGLSRKTAAEFSFFLAIPTMCAATAYDLYKNWHLFDAGDIPLFAIGGAASFASALLAVRTLIKFVSRHDYTLFAWYRIVFGGVVLATAWFGVVDWGVTF